MLGTLFAARAIAERVMRKRGVEKGDCAGSLFHARSCITTALFQYIQRGTRFCLLAAAAGRTRQRSSEALNHVYRDGPHEFARSAD